MLVFHIVIMGILEQYLQQQIYLNQFNDSYLSYRAIQLFRSFSETMMWLRILFSLVLVWGMFKFTLYKVLIAHEINKDYNVAVKESEKEL